MILELLDGNRRFVRPVDTALGLSDAETLNDLPSCTLTLATDDPINAQIAVPASWLRVREDGRPSTLYRFKSMDAEHREDGRTRYALEGAQCTLLDDLLTGHHELGGEGLDTRWVIEYILARQSMPLWTLGRCDFDAEYQYNFEDVSLLEALMSLGEVIAEDYAFTFDASGAPPWTVHFVRLSAEAASTLMAGRSMTGLTRRVDGRVVTRLVGRGYGEGDNQLTIAAVNGGADYLDADTIADWGVRVGVHADRRQTDAQTLMARMRAILAAGKNPRVSYEADALDLYGQTLERWDDHRVGDMVLVLDETLGRAVKTRITARSRDDALGDPANVRLTFDSSVRDTAEALNEVLDKIGVQELYAQGATNMYSQQISDSADPDHPLTMRFYVPGNALRINSCMLHWKIERFRSYATLAGSGGGSARTSSEGGGATVSIPAQTISTGVRYSSQPMDAEGSGAGMTGGAKNYDGTVLDRTSGPSTNTTGPASGQTESAAETVTGLGGSHDHTIGSHRHNFSDTVRMPGHGHTLGSSSTQTGGLVSAPDISVSGNTGYATPSCSDDGEHQHTVPAHSHGMNGHTHDLRSHTHTFDHVHNMPHVHNIAHEHVIPAMEFELGPHSHSVSVPDHTHDLEYGIFEGGRAEGLRILVDGEEVPPEAIGTGDELDAAAYMRKNADGKIVRSSWHEVEFVPDALTRITANLFFQVFIQSRGAGDY